MRSAASCSLTPSTSQSGRSRASGSAPSPTPRGRAAGCDTAVRWDSTGSLGARARFPVGTGDSFLRKSSRKKAVPRDLGARAQIRCPEPTDPCPRRTDHDPAARVPLAELGRIPEARNTDVETEGSCHAAIDRKVDRNRRARAGVRRSGALDWHRPGDHRDHRRVGGRGGEPVRRASRHHSGRVGESLRGLLQQRQRVPDHSRRGDHRDHRCHGGRGGEYARRT